MYVLLLFAVMILDVIFYCVLLFYCYTDVFISVPQLELLGWDEWPSRLNE